MRTRPIRALLGLFLGLELALLALPQPSQAYSNARLSADWTVGGPHRTINEFALNKFIEQAKSDPVLSKYDFANESLKVNGPRIGEPGVLIRGNWSGAEDKPETFQWWVKEGGYSADEPELYASFRHFYDPRSKELAPPRPAYLTDHLDQLGSYFRAIGFAMRARGNPIAAAVLDELGRNPEVDARDWAINGTAHEGWGENEYSWNRGVNYIQKAFSSTDAIEKDKLFAQGWRALGETMHLLADMTTPAHVRNDSHPAVNTMLFGTPDSMSGMLKGDAYETYAQEGMIRRMGQGAIEAEMRVAVQAGDTPDKLFDQVARLTNTNFFSGETVSGTDNRTGVAYHNANGMPDYPSPRLQDTDYRNGQFVKKIGSKPDVCLAHESWVTEIGWGSAPKTITRQCVESQASVLVPVAVAGNVKLVDWFIPRVLVEITSVDTERRIVQGTVTHKPQGAYPAEMKFSTAAKAFNPLRLSGTTLNPDDYQVTVLNGVLRVTYGEETARRIENARASGNAVVNVLIDIGGIEVGSNDFTLSKTTPTPARTAASGATPTSTSGSGDWVLESILPFPEPNPGPNQDCYFNQKVSVGDGTFASSDSWKEQGCSRSGPGNSGSRQIVCSWTAPPSYLKVGSTLSLSASCQTTDQRTGGGASAGGGGWLYLTLNPPADNLGARLGSSTKFLGSVTANTSGTETSATDSKSGSIKIPEGKRGDVLVIVSTWNGTGGGGYVVYKYAYGASTTPPIRTAGSSPLTPVPTLTGTVTPASTNTRTVTPASTNTRTVTPAPTSTFTVIPSAVEEIFRVFSIGVAYNGATKPTTFSTARSWLVTSIHTYHWNGGRGVTPGTIGLRSSTGIIYGPWKATGEPGEGGVPNAFWVVKPNVIIPLDTYTVLDSDPSTWAQNTETGGAGMAWGLGIRQ